MPKNLNLGNNISTLANAVSNSVASKITQWGNAPVGSSMKRRNGRRSSTRNARKRRTRRARSGRISQTTGMKFNTLAITPSASETTRGRDSLGYVDLIPSSVYYLNDHSYDAGMYLHRYTLNPTAPETFQRAPNIAENFQKYKLNGISVDFVPIMGAAQEGTVVLAIAADPTMELPHTWNEISSMAGAVKGTVAKEFTATFSPSLFNKVSPEKSVKELSSTDPEDDDILYTFGQLIVATTGNTTANPVRVGTLYISYNFTFTNPIVGANADAKCQLVQWSSLTIDEAVDIDDADVNVGRKLVCSLRNQTPYGYTGGVYLERRNPRLGLYLFLNGTQTSTWNSSDLGCKTSESGNGGINDIVTLTPLKNNKVDSSFGYKVYYIPPGPRFFLIDVHSSTVTNVNALFVPARFNTSWI